MDSGNSGSMQSSSTGGDEEYDSRAESSISAFLNNNPPPPPTHVGPFTTNPQHHHTHMFDPLSNYLDPNQRSPSHPNPNSILNLDMVWSKVARSEPNQPDLSSLISCSSSPQNQAFVLSQLGGQTRGCVGAFPTTHHSLPPESATSRGGLLSVSAANEQAHNNNNSNMVRNPKKRSRASRRAPTTVLTTDTTNFRAMVQEFTGIPAPPFTSSPFPRTRLDLFATSAAACSAMRPASTHLDPPTTPSYLLRPFAHKVQPQPSSIPSSSFPPMLDTLASNNSTNNSSSSNSTSVNYHHPLNIHNPILTFQSILQAPPKFPPLGDSSSVLVASKTQQSSLEIPPGTVDSHLKMGVLEELGLSHAHVGGHHHNMVPSSSDGALSRVNNNNMRNPSTDWAQRISNNDGGVLRSLSGTLNYRSNVPDQRVSNGKVNYSATPSDFHGEKGPDCAVAARSEGMVESWINCSSD